MKICNICGKERDHFKGSVCNSCREIYRRKQRKIRAVKYKGGKCSVCGYNKCLAALEFQHINPDDEKKSVAKIISSQGWATIKEEIDKCKLVCTNCRQESQDDYQDFLTKINKMTYHTFELIENRVCVICNREFTIDRHGNSGMICNKCRQKYHHYKLKVKAVEYKGNQCSICGYNKTVKALEFHHVNRDEKEFSFSTNYAWDKLVAELDKTILVCANCHREIHDQQKAISDEDFFKKYDENVNCK